MSSKNLFWSLINIGLIVVIIFGVKVFFVGGFKVDTSRLITVSGEGKLTVVPDIARAAFSVVSEGKDPKNLENDNAAKVNGAIDFVKKLGIDDKDVKTSNYNLYPVYDYGVISPLDSKRNPFIVGYRLTQTVEVKIRDLAKIGDVLGGLPGLGVNEINFYGFDVDEPEKYLTEAREKAFDQAHEKAKTMAALNNVRLKRVVTFSEGGSGIPRVFIAGLEDYGKGGAGPVPAPAPEIEPGSQEITVNVSVTYELGGGFFKF